MKRAAVCLLAMLAAGEHGDTQLFRSKADEQIERPRLPPLPYYDGVELTPTWQRPPARRPFDFELVTQRGTRVTDDDLRGRIHVASFIFTRCDGICPAMMRQLRRVQAEAPDVTLVSYSVTPSLDRPSDLAAFGDRHGVDPQRWLLVTGSASQIFGLARDFYFADDRRLGEDTGAILHTEKVLLVDANGDLRGVYNGTVPFDVERLLEDLRGLRGDSRRIPHPESRIGNP